MLGENHVLVEIPAKGAALHAGRMDEAAPR